MYNYKYNTYSLRYSLLLFFSLKVSRTKLCISLIPTLSSRQHTAAPFIIIINNIFIQIEDTKYEIKYYVNCQQFEFFFIFLKYICKILLDSQASNIILIFIFLGRYFNCQISYKSETNRLMYVCVVRRK